MTMCLSIRQPWAWLIVNGHKMVENRGRQSRHRGPLLIHAGKAIAEDAEEARRLAAILGIADMPTSDLGAPLGGIVGRVEMVDCVDHHPSPWFFGPWAYVFAEAEPLPFRPLRGHLYMWDVEETAGSLL